MAVGCHGKGDVVVGKWSDAKGMVVSFNADKTFTQNDGKASGTWSFADDKVKLSIEKIAGKPADQAIDGLVKALQKMNPKGITPEAVNKMKAQIKATEYVLSEDGKSMKLAQPLPSNDGKLTKIDAK